MPDRTFGTSMACLVCCVWPMFWAIGAWWLRGALPDLQARGWLAWLKPAPAGAPPVNEEGEL